MATSAVEICNIALTRLNVKLITAIDPPVSNTEKICANQYPNARDATLRSFPWNFAEKQAELALVSVTDKPGYEYTYAYPTDCVAARNLLTTTSGEISEEYQVISNDAGSAKYILSNTADLWLSYTSNTIAVPLFDASFVDALSWRLSAALVPPLKTDPGMMQAMWQTYVAVMAQARLDDAKEGKRAPFQDNPYKSARG